MPNITSEPTKFDISEPYAPIFCIGVAPTDPGIPDKFSNPYKFFFSDLDTTSSQFSPALTITEFPLTENPFKLFFQALNSNRGYGTFPHSWSLIYLPLSIYGIIL